MAERAAADRLLIVGSNIRNQELLAAFIERLGYTTLRADTLDALTQILDAAQPFRFALVDVTGFDLAIWECCARLHARDIPLLIISPRQSVAVRRLGYAHGAQAVMEKPLIMRELADAIHNLLQAVP
ncbi:MAG TPA: response regulator [Chloroflexi bacterium]|nr:response regulator [Chloroflexota bacterium]HHW87538.1 response regulator [Chloroflexota bacterium]